MIDGQLERVSFICPSNKLKVYEDNTKLIVEKITLDKKYKMTKQLGIEYCQTLIKNDTASQQILNSYTKKDDLCDAMLQGAHYLNKELIE